MSSPEKFIPQIKIVKRVEIGQVKDTQGIDKSNLTNAQKDSWPKEGNLSTPDLLEKPYAQRTFEKVDPIIDKALKLPPHRTVKYIQNKLDQGDKISELEKAVLGKSRANPDKLKQKARESFTDLFKSDSEKSNLDN